MIPIPILTIGGADFSRYLISCHMEQSANGTKDPGKYDLVLSNPAGLLTGSFAPKNYEDIDAEKLSTTVDNFTMAPKTKVIFKIKNTKPGCLDGSENTVTIFNGEIQLAEADELVVKINGSCTEGGMASYIYSPKVWPPGTTIKTIVNDLLDLFGFTGVRHIMPFNDKIEDQNAEIKDRVDFNTAMYEVSQWAQSIYFFDENDEFWFVPAYALKGLVDLTGKVINGSNSSSMVGYANHVDVYGASPEDVSERKTHNVVYAYADVRDDPATEWEYGSYGYIKAPPVYLPSADYATCKSHADKLLAWFRQYKDVPTVKISGMAPGLLAEVQYIPWNANMPPVKCDDDATVMELGPVQGIVTRRVVDFSADNGFTCSLDVATSHMNSGLPIPSEDYQQKIEDWYDRYRADIDADSAITNKYAGVAFV